MIQHHGHTVCFLVTTRKKVVGWNEFRKKYDVIYYNIRHKRKFIFHRTHEKYKRKNFFFLHIHDPTKKTFLWI